VCAQGFGFVEMSNAHFAKQALRRIQGTECEGHRLQLALSEKDTSTDRSRSGKDKSKKSIAPTTKLLVRNVPFETNKKELRELFGTFGQVKALRLPLKFDRSHRGFAFVDFLTKQEAARAYKALSATHFYGRHLVLE
jgi:multiple RNA-binding domain-containing protein 1